MLNFATNPEQNATNLFLGLEWPTIVNPFQHTSINNIEQQQQNEQHNCLLDNHLNETLLIADRITNSMQTAILNENILLNDEIINDNHDIAIDPDLLTLKPKLSIENM